MKCNRCTKEEELAWPQPYHKGDKPIRVLDGKPHVCLSNNPGFVEGGKYECPKCKLLIIVLHGKFDRTELCDACNRLKYQVK